MTKPKRKAKLCRLCKGTGIRPGMGYCSCAIGKRLRATGDAVDREIRHLNEQWHDPKAREAEVRNAVKEAMDKVDWRSAVDSFNGQLDPHAIKAAMLQPVFSLQACAFCGGTGVHKFQPCACDKGQVVRTRLATVARIDDRVARALFDAVNGSASDDGMFGLHRAYYTALARAAIKALNQESP